MKDRWGNINWEKPEWKIVFGIMWVITAVLLVLELLKPTSNWIMIVICGVFFAISTVCFMRAWKWVWKWFSRDDNNSVKRVLTVATFFTMVGLFVSVDSSVFTQSDGNLLTIISRIFNKDITVDISEIKNPQKPHLVIVLDMSNSMRIKKINKKRLKQEITHLSEKLKRELLKENLSENECDSFFKEIAKTEYEYDLCKLKLLDFVAQVHDKYEIERFICFGIDPINTLKQENDNNKHISLKEVFTSIKDCEKEHEKNQEHTDFIELFDEICTLYDKTRFQNAVAPKYSFIFFSDYIHDSETYYSPSDIENHIIQFCNSSYFSSFYYLDWKNEKDYMNPNDNGINVFPMLKKFIRKESGCFVPITGNGIELFNISSKTIIPVYYEFAYSDNEIVKTKLTFDSIIRTEEKVLYDVYLDSNVENEINYHHQFRGNEGEKFPLKIEIAESTPITLSFTGRITSQFPGHSLVFHNKDRGSNRFDIVFFKDFPRYVRFVVTLVGLLYIIDLFLWLFRVMDKNRKATKKEKEEEERKEEERRRTSTTYL